MVYLQPKDKAKVFDRVALLKEINTAIGNGSAVAIQHTARRNVKVVFQAEKHVQPEVVAAWIKAIENDYSVLDTVKWIPAVIRGVSADKNMSDLREEIQNSNNVQLVSDPIPLLRKDAEVTEGMRYTIKLFFKDAGQYDRMKRDGIIIEGRYRRLSAWAPKPTEAAPPPEESSNTAQTEPEQGSTEDSNTPDTTPQ
jgi:hypothetical protein